jgi:hypothetical protein
MHPARDAFFENFARHDDGIERARPFFVSHQVPGGFMYALMLMLVGAVPELRSLADVAQEADVVAVVEVRSTKSRLARDGRHVVTEIELDVRQSLRGAAPAHLTVLQRGGQVGEVVQKVSDEVAVPVSGTAVVCLSSRPGERFHALAALPVEGQGVQINGTSLALATVIATLRTEAR